jgi:hypothetical protein
MRRQWRSDEGQGNEKGHMIFMTGIFGIRVVLGHSFQRVGIGFRFKQVLYIAVGDLAFTDQLDCYYEEKSRPVTCL